MTSAAPCRSALAPVLRCSCRGRFSTTSCSPLLMVACCANGNFRHRVFDLEVMLAGLSGLNGAT